MRSLARVCVCVGGETRGVGVTIQLVLCLAEPCYPEELSFEVRFSGSDIVVPRALDVRYGPPAGRLLP